uniref:Uncharacterized protein n=1 Tax=Cacopsylla melanoneura TaxID=428564 RepID=A0A8D9AZA6_9HEMI
MMSFPNTSPLVNAAKMKVAANTKASKPQKEMPKHQPSLSVKKTVHKAVASTSPSHAIQSAHDSCLPQILHPIKLAMTKNGFDKQLVQDNRSLFKFSDNSILVNNPSEYAFGYLASSPTPYDWYVPVSKMFLLLPSISVDLDHPFAISYSFLKSSKIAIVDLPPMVITYESPEQKKKLMNEFYACTKNDGSITHSLSLNGFFIPLALISKDVRFKLYLDDAYERLYRTDINEELKYTSYSIGTEVHVVDIDNASIVSGVFKGPQLAIDVKKSGCVIVDDDGKTEKYSELVKRTKDGKAKIAMRFIVCHQNTSPQDYHYALAAARYRLKECTIMSFAKGLNTELLKCIAISDNPHYTYYVMSSLSDDTPFEDDESFELDLSIEDYPLQNNACDLAFCPDSDINHYT